MIHCLIFQVFFLKVYLFLTVLGLHCCVGLSPVVARGGSFLGGVHWLLIAVASLVAALEHKVNSCGAWV